MILNVTIFSIVIIDLEWIRVFSSLWVLGIRILSTQAYCGRSLLTIRILNGKLETIIIFYIRVYQRPKHHHNHLKP